MPIYEYQCLDCGERFDEMQRVSDPPLATCRACGGRLKKLISAPAFQFKGSGWYVTDYARKGKEKGAGEKPAAGEGEKAEKAEKKAKPDKDKAAKADSGSKPEKTPAS